MPTLRVILEEIAGLGPGYLISDHGSYWLAADVLARLESDAPERLSYSVSLAVPEAEEDGAIFASEEAYEAASAVPLYGVHRLISPPLAAEAIELTNPQL
jgi:hypothetical protein